MDRLAALQVFVRVAELGSFSAAARAMGASQPSVSQNVAALEATLGVRLIQRTTRRLSLTDAGMRYYENALDVLKALARTEAAVTDDGKRLTGRVRIQAPNGIGQRFIVPALMAFQAEHPDVRLDLALDDRVADIVAEGVDVAVRLGSLAPDGLVARRVGALERALVASPEYLAANGTPLTPSDLTRHRYVCFSGSADHDLALVGTGGTIAVPLSPTFVANNSFVLIAALLAGRGIGGVQTALVRNELESGALVRVLDEFGYPPLDVHVVVPTRRYVTRTVKALITCVETAMAGHASLRASLRR